MALLFPSLIALGDDTPRRSISTAGEATVYVVPDQAEVSLAVVADSEKLNDAKSANDTAAASVVQAIQSLGVEPKNISTNDVTVTTNYANYQKHNIVGYTVRRAYVVKVTDITLVSKVVYAALNRGATSWSA